MAQILNETFIAKGQIIESNRAKLPKGVLCRGVWPICNIGKLNRNNRLYEKAVFEKAIFNNPQIQEAMKNRTLFGHAEHPDKSQSDLQLTSHVIIDTFIKEENGQEVVYQTFDILDTPCGRIVNTLLEAGCAVGCSTRAEGDLEEAQDESLGSYYRVVPESYHYITTDFTADPSTYGSRPIEVIREIKSEIDSGLLSEQEKHFAVSLMEAFQRAQQEKIMKVQEALQKGTLKKDSIVTYQGKKGKVSQIKENEISVLFDDQAAVSLVVTDDLQVKIEGDKVEIIAPSSVSEPSPAVSIPSGSEPISSDQEAAPTPSAASEIPLEDTPESIEEPKEELEEQPKEEEKEEEEEDKQETKESFVKSDIHSKQAVIGVVLKDGSILYSKTNLSPEQASHTIKEVNNPSKVQELIQSQGKANKAKNVSDFFVDLGGSYTAYLFDNNKWWYLSAGKGGMIVPVSNESICESIKVGSVVQILDKKGNTVIVPEAKVKQIDTALGRDGNEYTAVEITGSVNEDDQEWYSEEDYQIVLLEMKTKPKDSFEEFISYLKENFSKFSVEQKAKVASILPCRLQEEVKTPSKAQLLKEGLHKAEMQTALEQIELLEKEKQELHRQYEAQMEILAEKVKEYKQKESLEVKALRHLVEQLSSNIKQLKEQLKQQQEKANRQLIQQYVDWKIRESRYPFPSTSRALLEKCASIAEVDKVFEEIRAALRRQALPLTEGGSIQIEQKVSEDPFLSKIKNVIDSI